MTGVRPPVAQLEREEFDGRLFFRLATRSPDDTIVSTLQAAGDIQSVKLEEPGGEGETVARGRQIRVDLRRLDTLMKQVGELVVAKNRLGVLAVGGADPALGEVSDRISRLVSAMQSEVIAARMTPVGEVFDRFPRLVRDLGRGISASGSGSTWRARRSSWIARSWTRSANRFFTSSGMRPIMGSSCPTSGSRPGSRRRAGSCSRRPGSETASRFGSAMTAGASTAGPILAKAQREGLVEPGVDAANDDMLLRVLSRPGFSTAAAVSGVSGRGVGVDVAVTRVRALGGTLEVRSEVGRGTSFIIRVPLTLAIVRALLADAAGERYAVPLAYVAETVEFDPRGVTAIRDREALVVRDRVIPTVHLQGPRGAAEWTGRAARPDGDSGDR